MPLPAEREGFWRPHSFARNSRNAHSHWGKYALYASISTNDKGQDPECQLRELRDYCERRGWEIAAEYVDRGIPGAQADSFARSVSYLLRVLETFRALGIEFVIPG